MHYTFEPGTSEFLVGTISQTSLQSRSLYYVRSHNTFGSRQPRVTVSLAQKRLEATNVTFVARRPSPVDTYANVV